MFKPTRVYVLRAGQCQTNQRNNRNIAHEEPKSSPPLGARLASKEPDANREAKRCEINIDATVHRCLHDVPNGQNTEQHEQETDDKNPFWHSALRVELSERRDERRRTQDFPGAEDHSPGSGMEC